jgi:thymidylate synthase (FAD)
VNVVLLQSTPEPERLVALAARLCYSPVSIADLQVDISRKDIRKLVRKVISMGHTSVLEHVSFTYGIEGISRATSHQLVRHRIASYSQQSQRYTKASGDFVIPPTIKNWVQESGRLFESPKTVLQSSDGDHGLEREMRAHFDNCLKLYTKMTEAGIPAEDARFVLPNATETRIIVTMNVRELHHFFALRLCRRAQWEIREMASKMFWQSWKKAPLLFEKVGPGCLRGRCPEGKMTCGEVKVVRREFSFTKKGSR